MIRYMGTRKKSEGATVYVFIVNGLEKEVRESALKIWFGRNGLAWHLARPTLDYLSPSFHPWQHDNRQLIESWLNHNDMAWRPVRPAAS